MEYILNQRQLCDLEMILNGGFSPLEGFMNFEDYLSVLENCRLKEGIIFPIPITLAIPKTKIDQTIKEIILLDEFKRNVALLKVEDIYNPDINYECLKTLGTADENHPYAEYLHSLGDVYYVGGKIEKLEGILHFDFLEYRMNTKEFKDKTKEYEKVLGFQTRNPMHNCHYYLSLNSLEKIEINNKLLALTPVVGITQTNDVNYQIRVRCYLHILEKYKANNINVLLCLLPLSMRMAGPREALWHAIIRKNFGCTHFVIGRDHAGPSTKKKNGESFYGPTEAHDFVLNFENELEINIIKSDRLVYDMSLDKYVLEKDCKPENIKKLSGTELREKLRKNEKIPEWFTLPKISEELSKAYKKGLCIYLIGLSGSGKTTISKALKTRLEEKERVTLLDGDEIRENLSQELGFSKKDRSINVRRIGYLASLLVKKGEIVICANIAPYEEDRKYNRNLITKFGKYIEIFVDTPLEICEKRDIKGLYKKARSGIIKQFTGISDPFEIPENSDLKFSSEANLNIIVDKIINII